MKRCIVENCGKVAEARDMCSRHLKRWQRHGHVGDTRPQDWGRRHSHPMYERWKEIRKRGRVCDEWSDFWLFVEDVGVPPSEAHTLVRLDTNLDYNKGNMLWRPPKFSTKMDKNEYFRKWREEDPEYFKAIYNRSQKSKPYYSKNWHLKRKYGITIEDFKAMLCSQEGVCAICKEFETVKENGRVRALHVDHCHDTGKVRGLLCDSCNRGLGKFKDNPDLLDKAAQYLRKHQE